MSIITRDDVEDRVIIPEDLSDWYSGGIAVDMGRKELAVVIDWDNKRDEHPVPKPFGGKREPRLPLEGLGADQIVDLNPMETARREGKEEIGFVLRGPGKPIFFERRPTFGLCLYRWDFTSQDFDEQVARSRYEFAKKEQELGHRPPKIVHVMSIERIITAGRDGFVPFYKEAILQELYEILDD